MDRPDRATVSEKAKPRWFGEREGRFGFGPRTWQGRSATFFYIFLVLFAVVIYSTLSLIVLVIGLSTVAFVLLVAFTSDLMDNWPPGS
jgi:hypothetical protein